MIKKLALLSVVGMVCLSAKAQDAPLPTPIFKTVPSYDEGRPLFIQGYMPDISLGKLINFKDTTAWRSDFGNKLLIFDFWNTHCVPCIRAIVHNDSLQRKFGDEIQIIMVTKERKEEVHSFIKKWEKTNQRRLTIPIVVEDAIIKSYFRQLYHPNYAWILPSGKLMLQTAKLYMNAGIIRQILDDTSNNSVK